MNLESLTQRNNQKPVGKMNHLPCPETQFRTSMKRILIKQILLAISKTSLKNCIYVHMSKRRRAPLTCSLEKQVLEQRTRSEASPCPFILDSSSLSLSLSLFFHTERNCKLCISRLVYIRFSRRVSRLVSRKTGTKFTNEPNEAGAQLLLTAVPGHAR